MSNLVISHCPLTDSVLSKLVEVRKDKSGLPPFDMTVTGCKMSGKMVEYVRNTLPFVSVWFNSGNRSWIKEDAQGRRGGTSSANM